ncbi:MAG: hypothetical protein WBQ25_22765 [Nitrososphaeraceae archaeon]
MLNCKFCQQELTFDDEHVSPKSRKKIPLNPDTMSPHRCEESLNAWRRDHQLKCRQCGTEIYFDNNVTSESGKLIPLESATEAPHDCPKSKYHSGSKGRFR